MADYNIYLHSVSNAKGNESPTTPWQLLGGEGGDNVGGSGGGGFSPSTAIHAGAAFLRNPDSAIGGVMSSTLGKLGIVGFIAVTAVKLTDKAITMYNGYASSANGDYKFAIDYNNFKNAIHTAFHPFSTELERQQNALQIKKDNLKNEQDRLLLGGSFINSPYGRYL